MTNEISSTMMDYLAEIYRLVESSDDNQGFVGTSALAELLDVSAPAVNRMVTKLRDMQLLIHEPYQGIRLTPAGQQKALIKMRNRRIAEAFLVNVMGFAWHEIYQEANHISGTLNEKLATRMLEMAGNPAFCPHGEPIPAPDGTVPVLDDLLLANAEVGHTYEITRVRTRESDRLEYIAALELTPGCALELIHAAPFNGPMQLKLNGEYRIIGHNLAEYIRVRRVES